MVLFVTHYPKIVEINNEFPGRVGAYHVSYITSCIEMESERDESGDGDVEMVNYQDVTYLYKLMPGVSERSFGFKVARLAQIPDSCIRRAIVMAAKLEADVSKRVRRKLTRSLLEERAPVNTDKSKDFDCSRVDGIEVLEELGDLCKVVFNDVNAALGENNDMARCFRCLEHAKSIVTQSDRSKVSKALDGDEA